MPVDVKETATQEELLEQFQTRYSNLISENQELAKKIKDIHYFSFQNGFFGEK